MLYVIYLFLLCVHGLLGSIDTQYSLLLSIMIIYLCLFLYSSYPHVMALFMLIVVCYDSIFSEKKGKRPNSNILNRMYLYNHMRVSKHEKEDLQEEAHRRLQK